MEENGMDIQRYQSGAPLEEKMGYSRMVKAGNMILIGGTTSVQPDGSVFGRDAYNQTKYVLEKQLRLLQQAGSKAEDVVSVDVFAVNMSDGAEIGKAYAEIFHEIRPLFTVVGTTELNRSTQLVEIKMTAMMQ
jgi:enamine deaminase RidA (YjgF/YER057c/UK114 family)